MPTNGLDFYAPFDSNFNDVVQSLSGSCNSPTRFKIVEDTMSDIGNYLQCTSEYNYSRYYIEYLNSAGKFNYGTGNFSVSYWMRAPEWTKWTTNQIILSNHVSSGGYKGFVIYKDGGKPSKIDMRVAGENNFFTSSDAQSTGWVHWCFVKKDGTGYWYKNGIQDSTGTCPGNADSPANLMIGDSTVWVRNFLYLDLKSIRIYNRDLSDDEVINLSREFDIKYQVDASDQSFNFSPVNNEYKQIVYSCGGNVEFQITSGSLPSSITFDLTTGKFYGKALTDADHTYDLVVRIYGSNVVQKSINVTLHTFATSSLSITSPQTLNFTTEEVKYNQIVYSSENYDYATYEIIEGELPPGFSIYQVNVQSNQRFYTQFNLISLGAQTSAITSSFVIAIKTTYHPTPVSARIYVNLAMNIITVPDKTLKFYVDDGASSVPIAYTSQKTITPVYSMNGTLPNGFTFNQANGTIDYDGIYSAPASKMIDVYVNSSTGASIQGTGYYTIQLLSGSNPIPSGVWLYCPCKDDSTFECDNPNVVMAKNGSPNFYTAAQEGRDCVEFNGSPKNLAFDNVFSNPSIPTGNQARSVNYWIKCPSNMGFPSGGDTIYVFTYGTASQWKVFKSSLLIKSQNLVDYKLSQDCYNGLPGGTWIVGTDESFELYPNGFDTNWHMITITYDQTNFKAYRDGELVIHKQLTGSFDTGTSYKLVLGIGSPAIPTWGQRYANPDYRLSDFRLWRRALTEAEVLKLYNE